jgi:hypothetical protein
MGGGSTWVRQLTVVAVALAVSAAWVLVDHPLEGPVLVNLDTNHGIHLTDPLIVIPLAWARRTVTRR